MKSYYNAITQFFYIVMWLTCIGVTMSDKLRDMLKTAIDEKKTIEPGQISGVVESMISENQDIKDELVLTGELVFNLTSDPVLELKVEIKDGKASFSHELSKEPDFFVEIPPETLKAMISGEKDVITPLMGGEIAMWKEGVVGDMSKAMDIIPLVTALAEDMELSV